MVLVLKTSVANTHRGFKSHRFRVTHEKFQFDSGIVHFTGYPAGARTCGRFGDMTERLMVLPC